MIEHTIIIEKQNKPVTLGGQSEIWPDWHAWLFCTVKFLEEEDESAIAVLLLLNVECIFTADNGEEGQDNGDEVFILWL